MHASLADMWEADRRYADNIDKSAGAAWLTEYLAAAVRSFFAQGGRSYEAPVLVLFSGSTDARCGGAAATSHATRFGAARLVRPAAVDQERASAGRDPDQCADGRGVGHHQCQTATQRF